MLIMALIMLVMIRILSNTAVEYDIKQDLRKSIEQNIRNLSMENGNLQISEDFQYESENVRFLIVRQDLEVISGEYPKELQEMLQEFSVKNRVSRSIVVDGAKYYVRDEHIRRSWLKNGLYLRGFVKKADAESHYRVIEWSSYLCIAGVLCVVLACELFWSKRISKELKKMCQTAERIGLNLDMSQRMEDDNRFQEIAVLAQANNRMLDRMEQTFQMQEQFTSDIAHELRTPVSVVMAQCQYTQERAVSKEDFDTAFGVIYKQSKKIDMMITQLLNFSRLDQDRALLQEETIDLVEIAESVCETQQEKAKDGISIRMHLEEAVTTGDIGLIVIVIQNLVTNAVKFSHEGGQIDVSTGIEGEWVYARVEDRGIGIAPEDLENIFRRFYQCDTSRNAEGFGLGLSLSEKIAQKHGGRISVSSEVGKGSVFTLYLPQK